MPHYSAAQTKKGTATPSELSLGSALALGTSESLHPSQRESSALISEHFICIHVCQCFPQNIFSVLI